jgi:cytidylate kinase
MGTILTDPHHLDHLVDRQQLLNDVRLAVALERPAPRRGRFAHLPEGPWLSISTELGALGHALAQRAAEMLGWKLFDQEILHAMATQAGQHEEHERILSLQDERPMSRLGDYINHVVVPDYTTRAEYEVELFRVIATVGRHGLSVLVGRGANWVLDSRCGLRVRVVAPRGVRVKRVAARTGITETAASHLVDKDEAAKRQFIQQVYHRDIADPAGYDLVLNTGELETDSALEVVLAATRHKLERESSF